jgi:hypothetical protein
MANCRSDLDRDLGGKDKNRPLGSCFKGRMSTTYMYLYVPINMSLFQKSCTSSYFPID